MAIQEITQSYFKELKKLPKIDKEREKRLLIMAKKGNKKAKEELVMRFQGLVIKKAKQLTRTFNENMDFFFDLIQEGNVALCKSIYEQTKSIPENAEANYFMTIISNYMMRALHKKLIPISLTHHISSELSEYKKLKAKLIGNKILTIEETAKKLNMPALRIMFLERVDYQQYVMSCDKPIKNEDGKERYVRDFIVDKSKSPLEEAEIKMGIDNVMKALPEANLTKMESKVLALTYGLFNETQSTWQEIKEEMNVYAPAYNQRSINKLRKVMHYDE